MIDEEKAKAEEAAQEELEQKLERLEGNLGNIRFVCCLKRGCRDMRAIFETFKVFNLLPIISGKIW